VKAKVTNGAHVGRHVAGGDHHVDDLDPVQGIGEQQPAFQVRCRGLAPLAGL
jgi:hypothetical protein